ncbi:hypothetical protein [Sphingomonas sp.]|uniref:hypothetical protein n=1 Tax=Sphingomonas sp. TaxID=28214 RepID=UPI00289841BD|nr:hypothetical protein [Sphingomonas sp.]
MIALLPLVAQALVAPQAVTPPAANAASAEPPHDWSTLPSITLPPASATMVRFVREEVEAGRCARNRVTDDGQVVIAVPMAMRPAGENRTPTVVPLAIGCPTVEQFSAGAALRMMRNLPHRTMLSEDRWYRTVITYTWPG